MDRWAGKVAVVTGASSGIGAAICVALANKGVCVVGLARRPELVEALHSKVSDKSKIVSRKCDVSNTEEVAATFEWIEDVYGGVHIMINNAGVFYTGSITGNDKIMDEAVLSTLDTNVKGTILCARHAICSMRRHGVDGHVININSIAGHYSPLNQQFNVYSCSKHAVTGFTASLLNEMAELKNKTKVTSLSPGLVMTNLEGVAHLHGHNIPTLVPEDVADAVLYVLSTPPHINVDELTITSVTAKRV